MPDRARAFARFAWGVLAWNVFVVLWGAFVRASGSGAGCGSHWPLCNGAVVPPSPELKTVIEFTHRVTSGMALLGVAALLIWALRLFPKRHPARRAAWAGAGLIGLEALLGAGLVLLRYVEKDASTGRIFYLCAHLTNTLLLLAMLAAAAWLATANVERRKLHPLLSGALGVALGAAVTGVVAALGDTVYPAASLAEGIRAEFSPTAPALVELRLLHPLVAVAAGFFLFLAAYMKLSGRMRPLAAGLTFVQLAAGVVNVLLLAPVWLQIVHLALAVGVWLAFIVGALETQRRSA